MKNTKRFKKYIDKDDVVEPNVCLGLPRTGLDCDFIVRGSNRKEFLKNGADHFINQHGMDGKEIYWDEIPVNFLCQSFSKVNVN